MKNVYRNAVANHGKTLLSHVGLVKSDTAKSFALDQVGEFDIASHGYSNGTEVVILTLTNGSPFVVGNHYYVVNAGANSFQLSLTEAGAAIAGASGSGTLASISEVTGGSPAYARHSVAWTNANAGTIQITEDKVFNVPVGKIVGWRGFSALTAGTNYGGGKLSIQDYAEQGEYRLLASDTGIRHRK